MALTTTIIRWGQRILGDGAVARWVARSGVPQLLRWPRDRKLLERGVTQVSILGHAARFAVTSRTHLAHIDALWREEALLQRILESLRDGDAVYDVGANIGLLSIALALARTGRITIHAFEPEANNAEMLRRNVALNAIDCVQVHAVALGDAHGSASLFVDPRLGAGSHSLIARPRLRGRAQIVEQQRGDDLAATLGAPNVVKIDVEGAELIVLRGMERLLRDRAVRELFIEVHPTLMPDGHSPAELHDWLAQRGYVRVWQYRRGDEWHEHYQPGP